MRRGGGQRAPAVIGKAARYADILLQPVSRLVKAENWTDKEDQIVADHFRDLHRVALIRAGSE